MHAGCTFLSDWSIRNRLSLRVSIVRREERVGISRFDAFEGDGTLSSADGGGFSVGPCGTPDEAGLPDFFALVW
jgi:hypothetical protein